MTLISCYHYHVWLKLVLLIWPVWMVSQETVYCTSSFSYSALPAVHCRIWRATAQSESFSALFEHLYCHVIRWSQTSRHCQHDIKIVCSVYAWYIGYSTSCQRSNLTLILFHYFSISPKQQSCCSKLCHMEATFNHPIKQH